MTGQLERPSLAATGTGSLPTRSPLEVRVLRSLDEILEVEADWDALACAAEAGNPFLTPDWTTAWLDAGSRVTPYILSAHDDGGLVAVWPLVLTQSLHGRVLTYVEGDVYGVLCAPGAVEAAANAFTRSLVERNKDWDLAILSDHLVGTPDGEAVARYACSAGLTVHRMRTSDYPYLDLVKEVSQADLEKRVGKKVVNEIKRRRRQLEGLGPVRVERARTPQEVLARFPEIVDLHRRRWHERSDTSGFSSDVRIAGMRAAAERFARRARLELDLLLVDEQLVAYSYGFVFGRRHVYYSPAFEPAYSPFSVSKLLLLQQLADAFADGLREFDFSRGAEPYKLVWANASRAGETVVLSHGGARSRFSGAAAAAAIRIRTSAKANDALVHFKRNTLGKVQARVSPRVVRQSIVATAATVARSVEDRGRLGTLRHAAMRALTPLYTRSSMCLYEQPLRDVEPSPVQGIEFGVLRPSEYAALVATGRHSLPEVVRLHYDGLRCFVARATGGVIASYVWVIAGRPVHVPERGQVLALGPDDIYFTDAYTRPTFRGRGLYTRLYTYAMSFYAREGRRRAVTGALETLKVSRAGIERAGFKLIRRDRFTKWLGHATLTSDVPPLSHTARGR